MEQQAFAMAHDMANALGRPCWVARLRNGQILATPNLGHAANYEWLIRINPKNNHGLELDHAGRPPWR